MRWWGERGGAIGRGKQEIEEEEQEEGRRQRENMKQRKG